MEPQWTKGISSETVCTFFYVFFIIYAILFGLALLGVVAVALNMKKMGAAGLPLTIQAVLTAGIGGTAMLFYYLICDRALLGGKASE